MYNPAIAASACLEHTIIGAGSPNPLRLCEIVNSGGFGVVYRAFDPQNRLKAFAVKAIERAPTQSRTASRIHQAEIRLHKMANGHPGIVTLHRVIEDERFIYLVMDFYRDGDLFTAITEMDRLGRNIYTNNPTLIKQLFVQLVDAVEHCHRQGVFHRDLKPENVLMTNSRRTIVIADFGLATDQLITTEFKTGSEPYMSPECIGELYKLKRPSHPGGPLVSVGFSSNFTDIWSLGVILFALVLGVVPFSSASSDCRAFKEYLANRKHYFMLTYPLSKPACDIFTGIFAINPPERPTLHELRCAISEVDTFTISDRRAKIQRARYCRPHTPKPRHHTPSTIMPPGTLLAHLSDPFDKTPSPFIDPDAFLAAKKADVAIQMNVPLMSGTPMLAPTDELLRDVESPFVVSPVRSLTRSGSATRVPSRAYAAPGGNPHTPVPGLGIRLGKDFNLNDVNARLSAHAHPDEEDFENVDLEMEDLDMDLDLEPPELMSDDAPPLSPSSSSSSSSGGGSLPQTPEMVATAGTDVDVVGLESDMLDLNLGAYGVEAETPSSKKFGSIKNWLKEKHSAGHDGEKTKEQSKRARMREAVQRIRLGA